MSNDDDPADEHDDESGLFQRLLDDLKPLRHEPRAPLDRPRARPRARFSRADDREVLEESLQAPIEDIETGAGEALRFGRPTVGRRTMRRLARGSYSVQAEIDLHGMTAADARAALQAFVADAASRGLTCIRVVHGKGLGSGHRGPVLKRMVNTWLRQWPEVLAFVSARQVDGGTGAVYVLLQK